LNKYCEEWGGQEMVADPIIPSQGVKSDFTPSLFFKDLIPALRNSQIAYLV